jgi:hypothetical protein
MIHGHDGAEQAVPVLEISNRLKYFWIKGQGRSLLAQRERERFVQTYQAVK